MAGPDTANAVPGTANMATNMAATMASIWSQWQEINDVVYYNGKIYVPQNTALRNAVISQYHDNIFAGHFGKSRTAELMRQTHDWPGAVRDVRRYCHDYFECQKAKPAHHKPFGLLNPLPVPPEPWHTVTMDFITDLPLSSTYGSITWDSILVVVNKLTKMAHYIPVWKTMLVADFIKVFIQEVVKHHGVSEVLVTDRDKLFTSEKWTSFCFHMRCRRNLWTAFHPQTDGQTERQNQSLEAYLRIFVDEQQEDWAKLLPCAEFLYNNSMHAATGKSPFQLNLGRDPQMGLSRPPIRYSRGQIRRYVDAQRLQDQITTTRERLRQANETYARYYNQHRTDITFAEGDLVLVNGKNVSVDKQTKKLHWKKLGPFKVQRVISRSSYKLDIPAD